MRFGNIRNNGFTLIELVLVIVITAIISVIAAPRFLNLSSDAKESRLQGIKAAIESGIKITHAKMVILGHDNAMSDAPIDIDGDGEGDVYSLYGYPVIMSNEDLNLIMTSDICIASIDDENCQDNRNSFMSETIVNSALLGDVDFLLSDRGAIDPDQCTITIENAKLSYSAISKSYTLESPPHIEVEVSGC